MPEWMMIAGQGQEVRFITKRIFMLSASGSGFARHSSRIRLSSKVLKKRGFDVRAFDIKEILFLSQLITCF